MDSEDVQKKIQTIKMGIPIDLRFGSLYPDRSMQFFDLNFFGNYNSELSYFGLKLHFNIQL